MQSGHLRNLKGGDVVTNYEKRGHGREGRGLWNSSIEGFLGELAVAKYLGLYPGSFTAPGAVDVGEHYEVRTRPEDWQDLSFKRDDKTDKYYILVTGSYGRYTLRGWISAPEILSHPEWFHDNGGKTSKKYWVSQDMLHPISELPEGPCLTAPEVSQLLPEPPVISSPNSSPSTRVIPYDSL